MIRNSRSLDRALSLITLVAIVMASFPVFPRIAEAAPIAVFADGFGDGADSATITGWEKHEDLTIVREGQASGNEDVASPNGGRFAKIAEDSGDGGTEDGYICREIDAGGVNDLTISYYWNGDFDTEAGGGGGPDLGVVEIRDNGNGQGTCGAVGGWTVLQSHDLTQDSESWNLVSDFNLSAYNDSTFLIRFRNESSADDEWFRVDGIEIEGEEMVVEPVVPECSTDDDVDLTTFDTFSLASVDGQNNWSATGPYDQEVVSNTYGFTEFGCKSLRISNAVTSGAFGDQTFAAPTAGAAGESSVATNNHFEAQFDIASTMLTEQPGLALSVSPDDGNGARMSYLSFTDTSDGIDVVFYDVTNAGPLPGTTSWNATEVATLDRDETHTIKFVMDFVDGPANDVVEIYIDGLLVHAGTSWEDYYRYDVEQSGNENVLSPVDTLIFRAGGTAVPANNDKGFLFDNMSILVSENEPEPTATVEICKMDQDDQLLDGWTLMLRGDEIEELTVPVNTMAGTSTVASLDNDLSYVALASGTWLNARTPDNHVDAEYSTEDGWITPMNGFIGYGEDILELQIDGGLGDWGPYNADHVYARSFSPSTNGPVNFNINDTNYSDNSGSLNVSIYEGYAGVTEEGCVTFNNVPYGNYQIDEILKDGWWKLSGLGAVVIDGPTESFEVVNSDVPPVDPGLVITNPIADGETLDGEHTFEAEYTDDDETVDTIHWAIKPEACELNAPETNIVGYGTDGYSPASYNPETGHIEVTVDMNSWDDGDYCIVINPQETGGQTDTAAEVRYFTLENPVVLSCEAEVNLLANASFEEPDITGDSNGWELVDPIGWIVERVNSTVDLLMEIQRGNTGEITWSTSDEAQMIELDGQESSSFSQVIPTIADKEYTLTWDFSPRPGQSLGVNQMEVFINGVEVASNQADGTGNSNTAWTSHSYSFVGDGNDVEVAFADAGSSDGYGPLLDNTSLSCNPNTGTINYCGDGDINGYEDCELDDEGCNNSCQFANQCHEDQLMKIALTDTTESSGSWNGKVYLGDSNKLAPIGNWFSVDEFGSDTAISLANVGFEGLAVDFDGTKMRFAWRGENASGVLDYVQGGLEFMGFDDIVEDDIVREINGTQFKLENPGQGFPDVFDPTSSSTIAFDMRADVGHDGVTLALRDGDMCTGPVDQAPAIPTGLSWRESDGDIVADGGQTALESGTALWNANTEPDFNHYIYKYWNNISTSAYNSETTPYVADNINNNELPGTFNQGEGTHYFCVIAVDNAGHQSDCSEEFTIIYDTTPPVPPTFTFGTTTVRSADLSPTGWFFYNDQTGSVDGVEGINNSIGSFVEGPATAPLGLGSAEISVPVEAPAATNARRNLATYQFDNVKLADITELKFSTYSQSAGNGVGVEAAPYLHFNVDFDGSDDWQRRLVFVPSDNGSIIPDTWQEWDAIEGGNALWKYSGANWPAELGGDAGSVTKTWNQIKVAFPNAGTRTTDSFLGIRVGEPYPGGFTGNIDGFIIGIETGDNTHTETYDFEPETPVTPSTDNTEDSSNISGGYFISSRTGIVAGTSTTLGQGGGIDIWEDLMNEIGNSGGPLGAVLGATAEAQELEATTTIEVDDNETTPTEDEEAASAPWKDWLCDYLWLLPLLWIIVSALAYWRKESSGDIVTMLWTQIIFGGLSVILVLTYLVTGVPCAWLPSALVAIGAGAMSYFGRQA